MVEEFVYLEANKPQQDLNRFFKKNVPFWITEIFIESSNFVQITIYHCYLIYSDEHKDSQKVKKTPKQSLSKSNESSKRFALQNIDEYIFIAFQKLYGKIIFHGLPFIFVYNLISPKIIKAAYNRKKNIKTVNLHQ